MAPNSKSLYYATLSLGVITFVALSCLALSDVWRYVYYLASLLYASNV